MSSLLFTMLLLLRSKPVFTFGRLSSTPGSRLFSSSSSAWAATRALLVTRAVSSSSSSSSSMDTVDGVSEITQRMDREAHEEMQKLVDYFESSTSSASTSTRPCLWTLRADSSAFVRDHVDAVLFDCDGVVYRSPDPAPGARECLQNLLAQNKQVLFVTNNAATSRRELRDKLRNILQMNDDELTTDMMIGSAFSAAQYLQQQLIIPPQTTSSEEKNTGSSGRLYVIGSQGLCEELRQSGFQVFGEEVYEKSSMSRDELALYEFPEHPVDAVVVGHDTDLHFRKLCIANVLLQKNPHARLVATNLDSHDLVGADGRHIPGNGGIVKALEYTSKRQAVNCGKPSAWLFRLLQEMYGLNPQRCMFVGDRLDTDIKFGIDNGMYATLVMTGVATADKIASVVDTEEESRDDEPLPTHIVPHMGYLA